MSQQLSTLTQYFKSSPFARIFLYILIKIPWSTRHFLRTKFKIEYITWNCPLKIYNIYHLSFTMKTMRLPRAHSWNSAVVSRLHALLIWTGSTDTLLGMFHPTISFTLTSTRSRKGFRKRRMVWSIRVWFWSSAHCLSFRWHFLQWNLTPTSGSIVVHVPFLSYPGVILLHQWCSSGGSAYWNMPVGRQSSSAGRLSPPQEPSAGIGVWWSETASRGPAASRGSTIGFERCSWRADSRASKRSP